MGIKLGGADARINPCELQLILDRQLVAVGQDTGLGVIVTQQAASNACDRDGFSKPGRSDSQCIAVFAERIDAALDEGLLTGAE